MPMVTTEAEVQRRYATSFVMDTEDYGKNTETTGNDRATRCK
jgi:hypothetical protein